MSNYCLKCANWTKTAKTNAKGEHWCRHLNTWTAPGFWCRDYDEMLASAEPTEWYSIAEVAERCFVDESVVRYWISTGRLKAKMLGSDQVKITGQFTTKWQIDKPTADRYIEWYRSIVSR